MGGWNWLDWTLAAIVVISVTAAALKGFIQELISLASLVAALAVAGLGYERAAGWFEDLSHSHSVAQGAGFAALFLSTLAMGALVALAARELLRKTGLQALDRVLGAVFGLARGVILDVVLLMVMVSFAVKPGAVQGSLFAPYVVTGSRVIARAMPRTLQDQFQAGFQKFRQAIIERDKKTTQK